MLETHLDLATPNNLLEIEGYNLVRADYLNNARWSTCYKESLPVRALNLPYFNESLLLEMSYNKKVIVEKFIIDIKIVNYTYLLSQVISMPDHVLGGLMTSILRREPNYLHKPLQMDLCN